MLQPRQQIERLQAVDAQRLEKVVVGRELFPRHFEMRMPQDSGFRRACDRDSRRWHKRDVLQLTDYKSPIANSRQVRLRPHRSPQTCATLLRRPDANKGRRKYRSLVSTPHTESSSQTPLPPPPFVCRIFPAWLAVARATRNASPSAAIWLTRPICCAFITLKLRPVSSKSRTTALPKSRFSRGIPPNPGISPSRNSGKQNRAMRSAIIMSQTSASSKPAAKSHPMHRPDRGQRRRIECVHHGVNTLQKLPHPAQGRGLFHLLPALKQLAQIRSCRKPGLERSNGESTHVPHSSLPAEPRQISPTRPA